MLAADADGVVIGVDLGGTNLRAASVSRSGEVRHLEREATAAREGADRVIARIADAVGRVRAAADADGARVRGVAVGAPGIIDARAGTVVASPNLPGWSDVPLRERVAAATGAPALLENDANAAAYGEHWIGAGAGSANIILVTLGTGVGGGLVMGGDLWRGTDGMAGEIGHMTIEPAGRPCPCGSVGCLEAYASATGIASRYGELTDNGPALAAADVHRLARDGDPNARQAFREAGRALGIAFASLVNLLNPERIVIGGGVLPAWDSFMPAVDQELRRRAFTAPAERVRIVPAALGDLAGLTGAAGLLWREIDAAAAGAAHADQCPAAAGTKEP